jgi:hypothetical protein
MKGLAKELAKVVTNEIQAFFYRLRRPARVIGVLSATYFLLRLRTSCPSAGPPAGPPASPSVR